ETHEEYRRKGLAAILTDRMSENIIKIGKKPVWAHSTSNKGSMNTALNTLPEYLWGYDRVTKRYSEESEVSFDKIAKCVKKHFVNAEAKDIKKVIG
ncbi:MAG: hypothetical protein K6C35_07545, partial [Eubacterium sp.]|nr:hypothetical protein [Eubacterium sp.]